MRRPLKVVHITPGLGLGGAETMLTKWVCEPAGELRHHVINLQGGGPLTSTLTAHGIAVDALGLPRGKACAAALVRLAALVRSLRPDILLGWMYHGNLAAQLAAALACSPARRIWSIHSAAPDVAPSRHVAAANAYLSPCADTILYVSQHSANMHAAAGFATRHSCVIPIGFDTTVFSPCRTAAARLRRLLQIGDDAKIIGMVARLDPLKDHANFFAAAQLLAPWAQSQRVHCLLVGPQMTRHTAAVTRAMAHHPLAQQLHFLGPRDDLPKLLPGFDVCTLSSRSEAFPNILGEAMACGVPCVATDVGDCKQLIGPTGSVVPPQAPQALAAAWRAMIELAPAQRQDLGEAARRRIVEHYNITTMRARLTALCVAQACVYPCSSSSA